MHHWIERKYKLAVEKYPGDAANHEHRFGFLVQGAYTQSVLRYANSQLYIGFQIIKSMEVNKNPYFRQQAQIRL